MRTRRSCLVALVCLLALQPGIGAPQTAKAGHSLWKIQGKTNAVYFFGSIHFLKKEFYPLAQPIEDAYRQSHVVVFETDIAEMEAPATQLKILQHGQYPPGQTLKQNLSPEVYKKLQKYVSETVGVAGAFDMLKPWTVAVALLGLELQRLGFDPKQGVDNYFHRKATEDKKTVVPLETVDFQMSLFSGLTKTESEAMLAQTLEEISAFKAMLNEMTTAWKTGDAEALDRLILDAMREYPEVHKKLLIDRNKDWAAKIEKMLAGGKNVFVVVGAAHLVGKESLVDLLAKKGFKAVQQ